MVRRARGRFRCLEQRNRRAQENCEKRRLLFQKLDVIGLDRVTRIGKAGEGNGGFYFADHGHWVENAADFKALISFHVDDLVCRRRRHVDAGADERHEQELLYCR